MFARAHHRISEGGAVVAIEEGQPKTGSYSLRAFFREQGKDASLPGCRLHVLETL